MLSHHCPAQPWRRRPPATASGELAVLASTGKGGQSFLSVAVAKAERDSKRCRAITAQFMDDQIIALFELTLQDDEIKIVVERHYRLVPAENLDRHTICDYRD